MSSVSSAEDEASKRFMEQFDLVSLLSKLLSEVEKKDNDELRIKAEVDVLMKRFASARETLDSLDAGTYSLAAQTQRHERLQRDIAARDALLAKYIALVDAASADFDSSEGGARDGAAEAGGGAQPMDTS